MVFGSVVEQILLYAFEQQQYPNFASQKGSFRIYKTCKLRTYKRKRNIRIILSVYPLDVISNIKTSHELAQSKSSLNLLGPILDLQLQIKVTFKGGDFCWPYGQSVNRAKSIILLLSASYKVPRSC